MTPTEQYQGWSIRRRTRTGLWIAVIALVVSRPASAAGLAPFVWLVALPFRIVGVVFAALFAFLRALLFLPARLLGHRG